MKFCILFIEVDFLFRHTSRIFHFSISWCAYELLQNCRGILQRTSGNNWIESTVAITRDIYCHACVYAYLLSPIFSQITSCLLQQKPWHAYFEWDLRILFLLPYMLWYLSIEVLVIWRTYSKYTIYMSEKISNENVQP